MHAFRLCTWAKYRSTYVRDKCKRLLLPCPGRLFSIDATDCILLCGIPQLLRGSLREATLYYEIRCNFPHTFVLDRTLTTTDDYARPITTRQLLNNAKLFFACRLSLWRFYSYSFLCGSRADRHWTEFKSLTGTFSLSLLESRHFFFEILKFFFLKFFLKILENFFKDGTINTKIKHTVFFILRDEKKIALY